MVVMRVPARVRVTALGNHARGQPRNRIVFWVVAARIFLRWRMYAHWVLGTKIPVMMWLNHRPIWDHVLLGKHRADPIGSHRYCRNIPIQAGRDTRRLKPDKVLCLFMNYTPKVARDR